MRVAELMTKNAKTVAPADSIRVAAELMRVHDVGFLPVVKQDRVVGALTDRDLVIRALARGLPEETPVAEVMTDAVVYCFEDDEARDAMELMEREAVRRLLVVNGKMGLVGVVALEDLAGAPEAMPELPESLNPELNPELSLR